MSEWWNVLTGVEQFYWTVAIAASIVFFFLFVVNLIVGFDTDTDMDGDLDVNADVSVTILSLKGLTAFFTFFGWAGVLFLKGPIVSGGIKGLSVSHKVLFNGTIEAIFFNLLDLL